MADYFSEYSSFIGHKGLPSPADTPYETPSFLRSKRSSRATTVGSRSRDQSSSPPPLPPDATDVAEKARDGRYTALDPRRFTPTLHASLVSEILSLRRELDSKNHLVENLESGLASVKNENDQLNDQLAASAKEVRVARSQVKQMESGTYEALETIANERNVAQTQAIDLRSKLDQAQKKAKLQDDDAERTQTIWDREKESWENERRQLERRIHVTETRLRKFVDEMVLQRSAEPDVALEEVEDESKFKDSGLGNESDSASVSTEPIKHRREISTASFKSSRSRYSVRDSPARAMQTPEPRDFGVSLADELDDDDFDADQSDDDLDYHDSVRRATDSRQSTHVDAESKAKRILGIEDVPASPIKAEVLHEPEHAVSSKPKQVTQPGEIVTRRLGDGVDILAPLQEVSGSEYDADSIRPRKVEYVDTGYQPSPPASPTYPARDLAVLKPIERSPSVVVERGTPAETPTASTFLLDDAPKQHFVDASETPEAVKPVYADGSTQTDTLERPSETAGDSLQLPSAVPAIAIHPPTSRSTSPQPYALPPGTKNASTQVGELWLGVDASVQTEEIRVDKRSVRLPAHLRKSYLLTTAPLPQARALPEDEPGTATIITTQPVKAGPSTQPPRQSPVDSMGATLSRDNSSKDLKSTSFKALALPKPTLAPAITMNESKQPGPLNRSTQFGVSHMNRNSRILANLDNDSEASDNDENRDAFLRSTVPSQRSGRFPPVEHPRNVPEDKELSPERRPATAESGHDAAPAPSIASSREKDQNHRARKRPPPKINTYASLRSRSPSFGSASDSNFSLPPGMPFPIPTRSSSRQLPPAFSEASWSPSADPFGPQHRTSRSHHTRQKSLRKVQSSTSIRQAKVRTSPRKNRRRLRSPDLTPVQSMAFDSPAPNYFPIPELPTPLQRGPGSDYQWSIKPGNSISSLPPTDENGLVDAIAGTMVGEWMWKYIRKRKLGVTESNEDFTQMGENGVIDISGVGTRHKRWVWLSPYERTIMWDSKQPMTGTALLGKKGRKLTIQAVIDVKDDTPLPKKPELEHAFHRSILILTPARALKFTATTAERHRLWMNALSFLAESSQIQASLPSTVPPPAPQRAPPPPPPVTSRTRKASPSFGRANIRDSVRLAKGKDGEPRIASAADTLSVGSEIEPQKDEGAEFPAIPRLYSSTSKHQRKRSNTSPRLPPLSTFRNFSVNGVHSTAVNGHPSTSNLPPSRPGVMPNKISSSSYSGSRSASVASPEPNFFEATGTVRMEAFVDPNVKNGVLYLPAPPSSMPQDGTANAHPRRKRGDSSLSATTVDKRRAGYVFDENGVDPFKGF